MTSQSPRRKGLAAATASSKLLALLLLAIALFGGSARGDTASLILLRPLALILCVVAAARLTGDAAKSGIVARIGQRDQVTIGLTLTRSFALTF